jgi:RNA polymerase sigma-70 factor (ECF subfamily)
VSRTAQEVYDELLVMRCQRRDLAAWNELVERWNDRLLYYLRRLIDHEHDARNVLQDVWLNVFRGIRALRSGDRLAPWLYTIARRTAMTHFRRDFSRREETSADEWGDVGAEEPDEQVRLENAEFVHYGLSQLALPDREVLTLFFLEDLTIDEMAAVLGIPSGTVKSRLFKARRDLRRVLEKEGQYHE